ncbi:MAG: glutathione S-transferase [Paracoccaceae bacterium]|nr:glutathione S-transferase [Paracoccaceae bacterium]
MQLFHNPASPYCRKVDVLLHETGHFGDVEPLPAGGHPTATGADANMPVAHNPLGKIPTLLRPDGPALYDSRVICRYLDTLYDAGLYPDHRLWEVLTLEATADGVMEAAVLMVYEGRSRPAELRHEAWVDAQWLKVTRALDVIEARWMSHLAGKLDMGHIAVACALGYLDFRHGERDWRTGRAALASWFATFEERPSMIATSPEQV